MGSVGKNKKQENHAMPATGIVPSNRTWGTVHLLQPAARRDGLSVAHGALSSVSQSRLAQVAKVERLYFAPVKQRKFLNSPTCSSDQSLYILSKHLKVQVLVQVYSEPHQQPAGTPRKPFFWEFSCENPW